LSQGQEFAFLRKSIPGEFIDLLVSLADLEYRQVNTQAANQYLLDITRLQMDKPDPRTHDNVDLKRLQRARYQWWIQNGQQGLDQFAVPPGWRHESSKQFLSCEEADVVARISVMSGDRTSAIAEVGYLQANGYADPAFLRFCRKHELCS
jgi:hypothetical protein